MVVLQSAFSDWQEFYNKFGTLFDEAYVRTERLLEKNPFLGRPYGVQPYRRKLIVGFHIGLFYTVEGRRIVFAAILDLRQSEEYIARRLERMSN